MKTKDHRSLGKYLLRELEVSGFKRAAFLWGSIQPDVNCFSHFSGLSVKGHYCTSCTFRADSFTFTHNDFFSGSLREHVKYEHEIKASLGVFFF